MVSGSNEGKERRIGSREMKYKLYQVNWSYTDGTGTNESIADYCIGKVLNFCCGKSKLGDVRVDLLQGLKPDVIADVYHFPFRRNSFDTVMLDPPFEYYGRFRWLNKFSNIAGKRLILCTPQIAYRFRKFLLKEIIAVVTHTYYTRLWYIYDRKDFDLDQFK